jgi:transcriptional regulator with XRE-family HTH domain
MAPRRQGLSQRRKAVGLTQESLAQRLGVERSTVVRWEAGDTEPLPSIRPNVARALQVSIDQLAELLSESENADTTRALPADTAVTIPVLLPEVQSRMWPSRSEFEDLIPATGMAHPAGIETHVGPETPVPATIEAGARKAGSRKAGSRRLKRFATAGVLALVLAGAAASVPFITSSSGPIVPATTGIRAPNPGSNDNPRSEDSTGTAHTAPAAAPNKPVDGSAPPAAAAVPAPHTTRSDARTTSRSKSAGFMTAPAPPRTPAIRAAVYAWFRAAELSMSNHRRTRLRPGRLSRR